MRFNAFLVSLFAFLCVASSGVAQEVATPTAAPAAVSASDATTLATAVSPVSPDDPGALLTAASEAASGGQWALAIGFLLMLGTWGLKKVAPQLPSKSLPWIATGCSLVGYLSQALLQGGDWRQALIHGFIAGATAVGLWEMIAKHLVPAAAPQA